MKVVVANVVKGFKQGGLKLPKVKANPQEVLKTSQAAPIEDAPDSSMEDVEVWAPSSGSASPHKDDSPPVAGDQRPRKKYPASAAKPTGQSRGRCAAAAAPIAASIDAKHPGDRAQASPKLQRGAKEPSDSASSPEVEKLQQAHQLQQADLAGCRASLPGSQRNSLGQGTERTGEEIWKLNQLLGKMVEKLADPEDAKQSRRRYKSPTLRERLRKQWGGTYGEKLEKELPPVEVEEAPAPKYEPPLFLEEANDTDDEDQRSVEVQLQHQVPDLDVVDATATLVTAPAAGPAKKTTAGNSSKASFKRPTQGAARKATAQPTEAQAAAAASPCAAPDRPAKAQAHDDSLIDQDAAPAERDEEPLAVEDQPRRGVRKTRVAEAATPAAAAKGAAARRPQARRGVRAMASTAMAAEEAVEQQRADHMDAQPAGSVPPTARGRKSHMPTSLASSNAARPPLAPAQPLCPASNAVDGTVEGTGVGTTKRTRETAQAGDETARMNKTLRMEHQQQLKEIEELRKRKAELESKVKEQSVTVGQLQGELRNAERAAAEKEKEFNREANEKSTAEREIERLRNEVKDRDDKIAALRDEVKLAKARETKSLKNAETMLQEWKADAAKVFARQHQQFEDYMKGVQRG